MVMPRRRALQSSHTSCTRRRASGVIPAAPPAMRASDTCMIAVCGGTTRRMYEIQAVIMVPWCCCRGAMSAEFPPYRQCRVHPRRLRGTRQPFASWNLHRLGHMFRTHGVLTCYGEAPGCERLAHAVPISRKHSLQRGNKWHLLRRRARQRRLQQTPQLRHLRLSAFNVVLNHQNCNNAAAASAARRTFTLLHEPVSKAFIVCFVRYTQWHERCLVRQVEATQQQHAAVRHDQSVHLT